MKKIAASLAISFDNQALKKDSAEKQREISCAVRAAGKKGALRSKGKLLLELAGTQAERVWAGRAISIPLDRDGNATFEADSIKAIVDEALGEGASIERFEITFDGAGGKKTTLTELDCWQQPG